MVPNSNNLVVLEWDRDELRYLWAGQAARRLVIRAIGRIQPGDTTPTDETPATAEPTTHPTSASPASSADSLLGELKLRLRAKNSRAILVLSRGDVEEFEATLPPASDAELAELVINEAHKHLANADEARLDYLEVERAPDQTRRLSIFALPQPAFAKQQAAIKQQGWTLSSLPIRHVAAASLLRKQVDLSSQPRSILVNLNRNDIELLIFEFERIILVRTISFAADNDPVALAERLAIEIQRSLMVTAKAEAEQTATPDQIYIFGQESEQRPLADRLTANLQLATTILNPIEAFVAFPKDLPSELHHFTGLLGSLIEEPADRTIDLLNSKCGRPKSPWLRRGLFYGGAAAAALVGTVWWAFDQVSQIQDSNADLKRQLTKLEKQLEQLEDKTAVVEQISAWRVDDINWLDELRELSDRFPERSLVQVKSMTLSSSPANPGVIAMNLQAKNESVITQMEQTIRDEFHQVRTNQFSQSDSEQELPWQFGANILVSRRDRDQFLAPPAATSPPANQTPPSPQPDGAVPPESPAPDANSRPGGAS
ncbi:MAG: hypothetical protein ACK493_00050 [Planctomycetota bacterium]|nr:hypothetical protein [Blastopirellula sp.]